MPRRARSPLLRLSAWVVTTLTLLPSGITSAAAVGSRSAAMPLNAGETPARVVSIVRTSPVSAGMRIQLDSEHGATLVEEVIRQPVVPATLDSSTEGLVEQRRADGSFMVDLQGRFLHYSVARLDARGRPRLTCQHGVTAAQKAMHECAPVEPAPARAAE